MQLSVPIKKENKASKTQKDAARLKILTDNFFLILIFILLLLFCLYTGVSCPVKTYNNYMLF